MQKEYEKHAILTNRQYLTDASLVLFLKEKKSFFKKCEAINRSSWGFGLVGKTCVPTAQFCRLKGSKDEALIANCLEIHEFAIDKNCFAILEETLVFPSRITHQKMHQ